MGEHKKGTYKAYLVCSNCGRDKEISVPRGEFIEDYFDKITEDKGIDCKYCGCEDSLGVPER